MHALRSMQEIRSAQGAALKCRLCQCHLSAEEADDFELELCGSCKSRPEARRLGLHALPSQPSPAIDKFHGKAARAFTEAEQALIGKVHSYMPGQQLLAILNERLSCDLGPDAAPYTAAQLQEAVVALAGAVPSGGQGWSSLRRTIAQARQSGLLAVIDDQVIGDFAVVFSLNAKQVTHLRDILL